MDARALFDGLSQDSRGHIDANELLVRSLERGMAVEEVGALFRALPALRNKGTISFGEFEAGMRAFPQVIGTTPSVAEQQEAPGKGSNDSPINRPAMGPVLRPDPVIMASLQRSAEASRRFIASEAAAEEAGCCAHTHLQEWLGVQPGVEALRCQRCSKPITDFGWSASRVEEERALAKQVFLSP